MPIVWTEPAKGDLFSILFSRSPTAALTVEDRILSAVECLPQFPRRGRPGRVPETREPILPDLPYLVVYGVVEPGNVVVYRILRGARDIASWSWEA